VWPALRADYPDATWKIVGKNPCQRVQALAQQPGIEVTGQVEDIRPWAHEAAAVVLPMRCGGGIKNKLLEAAAMGKPILASPRAVRGLEEPPGLICRGPAQWRQAIERVWSQPDLARTMGQSARSWAQQRHTWPHAAQQLLQKIPRFALRLQPVESKLHQRTSCRNATGRAA
ncbi:MAG TPA: glycosyltransferase family 4 protein, partial [Phycisphaeraceae bacterium]